MLRAVPAAVFSATVRDGAARVVDARTRAALDEALAQEPARAAALLCPFVVAPATADAAATALREACAQVRPLQWRAVERLRPPRWVGAANAWLTSWVYAKPADVEGRTVGPHAVA